MVYKLVWVATIRKNSFLALKMVLTEPLRNTEQNILLVSLNFIIFVQLERKTILAVIMLAIENNFSDLITYHDPNSCHWIEFPYHCNTDVFTDTTTSTNPTSLVTSGPTSRSTSTERSSIRHSMTHTSTSSTSTSSSTATSQVVTAPTVASTTPKTTTSISDMPDHNVLCDNLLENGNWDCSNGNKPGSLCVRFCNDNAFESKRCLCNSKSICAWTVKGKPCNNNKLAKEALEDKLGSLTSIFKYIDIVNTPNGKINVNFDLNRDKPRQFL